MIIKWTEELDARLLKMVADNVPMSQIAVEMGTTRNAVAGRAFRLNTKASGAGFNRLMRAWKYATIEERDRFLGETVNKKRD